MTYAIWSIWSHLLFRSLHDSSHMDLRERERDNDITTKTTKTAKTAPTI